MRCTFTAVSVDAQEFDGLEWPSRAVVASRSEYLLEYKALQRLSRADGWSVQLYELVNTPHPIPVYLPGKAAARVRGEPLSFWPVRRRRGGQLGDDSSGGDDDGSDQMSEHEGAESEEGRSRSSDADMSGHEEDEAIEHVLAAVLHDHELLGEVEVEVAEPPDQGEAAEVAQDVAEAGLLAGVGEEGLDAGSRDEGVLGAEAPPAPPSPVLRRGRADVFVRVPGGSIGFYAAKDGFQATCCNPLHGKSCTVSRQVTKRAQMRGRPAGLLVAWLAMSPLTESKAEHHHMLAEALHDVEFRQNARAMLKESEEGLALIAKERPSDGDDLDEPRVWAGTPFDTRS